jgi:hypothetical protein
LNALVYPIDVLQDGGHVLHQAPPQGRSITLELNGGEHHLAMNLLKENQDFVRTDPLQTQRMNSNLDAAKHCHLEENPRDVSQPPTPS